MRITSIAPLAAAAFAALGTGGGPAYADADKRVSGPYVHENLAIYFIHAKSAPGPVPLTLTEALAKGRVEVVETGQVNELRIENKGDEEVFIQAGDIVKGGRQDRVLMVSLLLQPRSGQVPIASFCVEAGRWSGRAGEDSVRFASAFEAMPSRAALKAMAAPPAPDAAVRPAGARPAYGGDTSARQRMVWDSVAKVQADLSAGIGERVQSLQSASSLQLSLENAKLKEARAGYVGAIEAQGLEGGDIVGYVAAINGRTVSANVYPSSGLFRKMWGKQLAAVVTEAIGDKGAAAASAPPPPASAAQEFLAGAEKGPAQERETTGRMRQETRDGADALYNEARTPDGRWVHRNYLAK
jgi:hypothetical protein